MQEHPFPNTLFLPDHSNAHPELCEGLNAKGIDRHTTLMRFEEFMMYELSTHLGFEVCYEIFDPGQASEAKAFAEQNSSEMQEKLQRFDFSLVQEMAKRVLQEGEFWVKTRPAPSAQVMSMRTPWWDWGEH